MPSKKPRITVRLEDEKLKNKLERIARNNGRSLSKEIEQMLKRYVESYEKKYGEINIDNK